MIIYFPPNMFSAIRTQRKGYSLMVQRTIVRVRTSTEKSNRRSHNKQDRNVSITQYFNRCCSGKTISITYSECVCFPACNAHAPYCHIWLVRLYNIFPHYLKKKRYDFRKKLLNIKCVLLFSLHFCSKHLTF